MALRAIDVGTAEATRTAATLAPATEPALATVHELHPVSRTVSLSAHRRERRRWSALGVVVLVAPFAGCLCVLGVVR